MTDKGRTYTTCPHCGKEIDNPEGERVAWVVHPCIACRTPHGHPKAFLRAEVGDKTDDELLSLSVDAMKELEERAENE